MGRTLGEIKAFVRGAIDLDVEELPDAIIDVFIAEGYENVREVLTNTAYYEKTWSLDTVDAQQEYVLSDIGDGDISDILAIQGPHWELQYIDHTYAESVWTPDVITSQEPTFYSFWGGSLFLWPKPDAVYELQIRGFRTDTDWMSEGAGAFPDLPADGHDLVAIWALSQTYSQQDDPELAGFYAQKFERGLVAFKKRNVRAPAPQPLVLNRRKRDPRYSRPSLRYPFPIQ